jgi:hypothetical protein
MLCKDAVEISSLKKRIILTVESQDNFIYVQERTVSNLFAGYSRRRFNVRRQIARREIEKFMIEE